MNILYHLHHPPGGFVLTEIQALRRRGHNIAIFVMNEPEDGDDEAVSGTDIPLYCASPSSLSSVSSLVSSKINKTLLKELSFIANPKYHLWALDQSLQCIKFLNNINFDIDLIHGHFATQAKLSAVLAARYFEVPCTVTAHAADIYKKSQRWLEILLNRMDSVITISEYNSNYLINDVGVRTPVKTVYLGVDTDRFKPRNVPQDPSQLVSVSRLVEKKGLQYNIEAVNELKDRYPELRYHIVGDGKKRDTLQRLVSDYDLNDSVRFLGRVSDERLREELATASSFVMPCVKTESGNRDGIPVALMEAMSMETVPISTKLSGIPELIKHKRNGLLVDPRDVDDLSGAIRYLLENPDHVNTLGQAARQTVKSKFNLESQTTELLNVFGQVIESYQN